LPWSWAFCADRYVGWVWEKGDMNVGYVVYTMLGESYVSSPIVLKGGVWKEGCSSEWVNDE
jgi:hypothetical protein